MPTFEVEGTEAAGHVTGLIPPVVMELSAGALVDRSTVEREIDWMLTQLRKCWQLEPDQVMSMCMAISARCTELAVHLHRLESQRQWKMLRTQQVGRVLEECDRQFRGASRLTEIRRQDIDLSRGQ